MTSGWFTLSGGASRALPTKWRKTNLLGFLQKETRRYQDGELNPVGSAGRQ